MTKLRPTGRLIDFGMVGRAGNLELGAASGQKAIQMQNSLLCREPLLLLLRPSPVWTRITDIMEEGPLI
jgi:hypothetical protein